MDPYAGAALAQTLITARRSDQLAFSALPGAPRLPDDRPGRLSPLVRRLLAQVWARARAVAGIRIGPSPVAARRRPLPH